MHAVGAGSLRSAAPRCAAKETSLTFDFATLVRLCGGRGHGCTSDSANRPSTRGSVRRAYSQSADHIYSDESKGHLQYDPALDGCSCSCACCSSVPNACPLVRSLQSAWLCSATSLTCFRVGEGSVTCAHDWSRIAPGTDLPSPICAHIRVDLDNGCASVQSATFTVTSIKPWHV